MPAAVPVCFFFNSTELMSKSGRKKNDGKKSVMFLFIQLVITRLLWISEKKHRKKGKKRKAITEKKLENNIIKFFVLFLKVDSWEMWTRNANSSGLC